MTPQSQPQHFDIPNGYNMDANPFVSQKQAVNPKRPFRAISMEESCAKAMPAHYNYEPMSPVTGSTEASSDEEKYSSMTESDNMSQGCCSRRMKTENSWKRKVKTELCKFWLNNLPCENSQKELGCGFAHGEEELQKKKGLNKQYMTSVCKNFLEHPSKCTYGQRCIFQHPTYDVRVRQSYTRMMEDNQRYTAMRLFQEIEGAETIYINAYAAKTPRLAVFRGICSSAKDNGEDHPEEDEDYEAGESGNSSDSFGSDSFDSSNEDMLSDIMVVQTVLKSKKK